MNCHFSFNISHFSAGKVHSFGAMILYCLNLPIEIRFQLENIFILSLIPGAPNTWTISHILQLFVNIMNQFADPGKVLATHRNPQGVPVAARVVPLLADLGAIRKVAGYLGHMANFFCSVCLVSLDQVERLDINSWIYRDTATIRMQANAWRTFTTIKAKEAESTKTGVRFTPMHELWKWDPVLYLVLGFMHNWLEGVLQHHLRMLWGVGRDKATAKEFKNLQKSLGKEEEFSDLETSESEEELEELEQEAEMASDVEMVDVETEKEASTTPTAGDTLEFDSDAWSDDEDDDADFLPAAGDLSGAFNFTTRELNIIRTCIQDVSLPTWVSRPPANLGEAKHGKLKAQELLVLFTVIFPLIIPELWWSQDEIETALLKNFHQLTICTNIICSYTTSEAAADEYTGNYIQYRSSMVQLFPHFNTVPNHHYAMHNGRMLKFWGPLASLSEFPGERMNGQFGRVKTNRHLCK